MVEHSRFLCGTIRSAGLIRDESERVAGMVERRDRFQQQSAGQLEPCPAVTEAVELGKQAQARSGCRTPIAPRKPEAPRARRNIQGGPNRCGAGEPLLSLRDISPRTAGGELFRASLKLKREDRLEGSRTCPVWWALGWT